MSEDIVEVVVCAANRMSNGLIICGARHWDDIMRSQFEASDLEDYNDCEQGFINQFGKFLTREEALEVVIKSGQKFSPENNVSKSKLFSEGLY